MILNVGGHPVVLSVDFSGTDDFPPLFEDATGFFHEDEGTYAVLVVGSLPRRDSLFVVSDFVSGARSCLAENQGLVDGRWEPSAAGVPCRSTVVKTKMRNCGIQYSVTIQLDFGEPIVAMNLFAEENGITGVRDAAIFSSCRDQNLVAEDGSDWLVDPFEDKAVDGFPMNLSELRDFDAMFPSHPLSEARRFIDFVCCNN